MESPLKHYRKLNNIDGIRKIATDTIFTKYIIKNLKGDNKQDELDSTDQESILLKTNGGYPLPGCIYTFIYTPDKNDQIIVKDGNKEKKYIDYVPIVFCTSVDKKIFRGINLNSLPSLERVKFFETYYNLYKDFFKDIEELTDNNKLALNNRFINLASGAKSKEIINLMSEISKSNFNYGYRSYNINRINQLRMIEYSEWAYIPHYMPIHAFKLMNQKEIHNLYYKYINKIN